LCGSGHLGLGDPAIDDHFDISLNVSKGLGLSFIRSVEVDAVTTVCAVHVTNVAASLDSGVVQLHSHTSPLPWIFRSVGEVDVRSGDVQATVPFVGRDRPRNDIHSEDRLAVRSPEGIVELRRA